MTQTLIQTSTLEDLLIYSFRYCLGRQSYAVNDCIQHLTTYWPMLHMLTRKRIQNEITMAISEGRAGSNWDVQRWETILKLECV